MPRTMSWIFPGIGLFIFSLILLNAGAFWPELAEAGALTGFGVILFFVDIAYIMMKVLSLVVI